MTSYRAISRPARLLVFLLLSAAGLLIAAAPHRSSSGAGFIDLTDDAIDCRTGAPLSGAAPVEIDLTRVELEQQVMDGEQYWSFRIFTVDPPAAGSATILGGIEFYDPQRGGLAALDEAWFFNNTGNLSFNFEWHRDQAGVFGAYIENGAWMTDPDPPHQVQLADGALQVYLPQSAVDPRWGWFVTLTTGGWDACDEVGLGENGMPGLFFPSSAPPTAAPEPTSTPQAANVEQEVEPLTAPEAALPLTNWGELGIFWKCLSILLLGAGLLLFGGWMVVVVFGLPGMFFGPVQPPIAGLGDPRRFNPEFHPFPEGEGIPPLLEYKLDVQTNFLWDILVKMRLMGGCLPLLLLAILAALLMNAGVFNLFWGAGFVFLVYGGFFLAYYLLKVLFARHHQRILDLFKRKDDRTM